MNFMNCVAKNALGRRQWIVAGLFVLGFAVSSQPGMSQVSKSRVNKSTINKITFKLTPQPKFVSCLGVEGGPTPTATVTVTRGELHDILTLTASNLKPKLGFDLFTIQNSNLLSNGEPNTDFVNFGLAWYQTDVQANEDGEANVTIATVLLDQIFGFDPATDLPPTHAFHVGFWFTDPSDAAACGFTGTTPFNGEQNAGPNAMISLPNATTNLGPLCTAPEKVDGTFVCKE
jgi:hypothetical protein